MSSAEHRTPTKVLEADQRLPEVGRGGEAIGGILRHRLLHHCLNLG